MTSVLVPGPASDAPESHADWLELLALSMRDRNSSLQDLVQELRRSGSTDALEDAETIEDMTDGESYRSQVVAEDAFGELSSRAMACGSPTSEYPFKVHSQYIQAENDHDGSIYAFLLLLSKFGKNAGPKSLDAADLFEQLSAAAARQYFGGADRGARAYLFGFPRRVAPNGFSDALDDLCRQMMEGGGCKDHPKKKDQKDAKLDIVAWRTFDDGRVGKLVGFGQCATGADWPEKVSEMHPRAFCQKWLLDSPKVEPVRMFFVPHRVEHTRWDHVCIDAGILFDRCRIAALTSSAPGDLRRKCARWTRHVRKAYL